MKPEIWGPLFYGGEPSAIEDSLEIYALLPLLSLFYPIPFLSHYKNILWPFHLGCFGLFLAYFSRTVASVFAPFPSSLVAHTLEVSYVFVSVCGARRVQFVCPPLLTLSFPSSLPRRYHSPTHSWAVTGERCGLDSQRMQRTLKLLIAMVVSRNDKLSISVRATASF